MTTLASFYAMAVQAPIAYRRYTLGAAYVLQERVGWGESIASARARVMSLAPYANALIAAGLDDDLALVDSVGGGAGAPVQTPQVFIDAMAQPQSNTSFATYAQLSTAYFGAELDSAGTVNNEVVYDFYAEAGTYTLDLLHRASTNRGVYTIAIDGVDLATQVDGYAAALTTVASTIQGIVIGSTGTHTIRLRMATKNPASSSFFGSPHAITLTIQD